MKSLHLDERGGGGSWPNAPGDSARNVSLLLSLDDHMLQNQALNRTSSISFPRTDLESELNRERPQSEVIMQPPSLATKPRTSNLWIGLKRHGSGGSRCVYLMTHPAHQELRRTGSPMAQFHRKLLLWCYMGNNCG
jgi:hypothetical protein